METLTKTVALDLRGAVRQVGDVTHFRGTVVRYGVADERGDVFAPGSFDSATGDVPLLWNGSADAVVGFVPSVFSDKTGLHIDGRIVTDTKRGREAVALIRSGALRHLGVEFRIPPGGAAYSKGHRRIESAELLAVSLSTLPQQAGAAITNRRDAGRLMIVDLDVLGEALADARKEVALLRAYARGES